MKYTCYMPQNALIDLTPRVVTTTSLGEAEYKAEAMTYIDIFDSESEPIILGYTNIRAAKNILGFKNVVEAILKQTTPSVSRNGKPSKRVRSWKFYTDIKFVEELLSYDDVRVGCCNSEKMLHLGTIPLNIVDKEIANTIGGGSKHTFEVQYKSV